MSIDTLALQEDIHSEMYLESGNFARLKKCDDNADIFTKDFDFSRIYKINETNSTYKDELFRSAKNYAHLDDDSHNVFVTAYILDSLLLFIVQAHLDKDQETLLQSMGAFCEIYNILAGQPDEDGSRFLRWNKHLGKLFYVLLDYDIIKDLVQYDPDFTLATLQSLYNAYDANYLLSLYGYRDTMESGSGIFSQIKNGYNKFLSHRAHKNFAALIDGNHPLEKNNISSYNLFETAFYYILLELYTTQTQCRMLFWAYTLYHREIADTDALTTFCDDLKNNDLNNKALENPRSLVSGEDFTFTFEDGKFIVDAGRDTTPIGMIHDKCITYVGEL